jgi:hypothetical protein
MIRTGTLENLTAPRYAVDLGEAVELVEEFALYDAGILADWTVAIDPELGDWPGARMVVRWDRTTVVVRERGDLDLARRIALERATGLSYVRTAVAYARAALGWGRGEPHVRCVVCRTSAPASAQHKPGGLECGQTRRDRLDAWAT